MEESCRPRVFLEVHKKSTKNIEENFGVSHRTSPKYLGQFARSPVKDNGIIYKLVGVLRNPDILKASLQTYRSIFSSGLLQSS